MTVAQGVTNITVLARDERNRQALEIPDVAREVVDNLRHQLTTRDRRIRWYGRKIEAHVRASAQARRLRTIPVIGPITASAVVATVGDGRQFRNGRELAARLGLTPLNRSSGGKERLSGISKCETGISAIFW